MKATLWAESLMQIDNGGCAGGQGTSLEPGVGGRE